MGALLFGVGRLVKLLAFMLVPVIAAAVTTRPTDIIWVIAISVICTLLAVTAFVNSYVNFESRFVQWFSHLTSSPRWFTIWLLLMVLWVPLRHILVSHGFINSDTDFVVATILWSCVPYMVENVLKSATARQMAVLTELIVEIRAAQDRAEERDAAFEATLTRVLDAIEDREGVTDA